MAMTMTISNNSSAKRITVLIPTSSGDAIEAWVYLPEGSGPHPALVMAHAGAVRHHPVALCRPVGCCGSSVFSRRESASRSLRHHRA
jgi:hypothetical protein